MTGIGLPASYWTIAGGAEPPSDHKWSPVDFEDRVGPVVHAAFLAVGIWHADLSHTLEPRVLRAMKRVLADRSIEHVEPEFPALRRRQTP